MWCKFQQVATITKAFTTNEDVLDWLEYLLYIMNGTHAPIWWYISCRTQFGISNARILPHALDLLIVASNWHRREWLQVRKPSSSMRSTSYPLYRFVKFLVTRWLIKLRTPPKYVQSWSLGRSSFVICLYDTCESRHRKTICINAAEKSTATLLIIWAAKL